MWDSRFTLTITTSSLIRTYTWAVNVLYFHIVEMWLQQVESNAQVSTQCFRQWANVACYSNNFQEALWDRTTHFILHESQAGCRLYFPLTVKYSADPTPRENGFMRSNQRVIASLEFLVLWGKRFKGVDIFLYGYSSCVHIVVLPEMSTKLTFIG